MVKANILFSKNWNGKLGNDFFTTIRLFNPSKYQLGELYNICLGAKGEFSAKCVALNNLKTKQIPSFLTYTDAGLSKKQFVELMQRMYKGKITEETEWHIITLERLK